MQNLLVLVALGLASYRATQLVVWDSIGDGLRLRLKVWRARKDTSRVRAFLDRLVSCPYCAGWWLSLVTTVVYLTAAGVWDDAPLLVHAVEVWTVMGIQALLNRWDDSRPSPDHEGN